jgi:tetratricopeptide (TPR) repeat protein
LNPSHPEALFQLSLLYADQKNFEKAADLCKQAVTLKPDLPGARYSLGKMYIRLGKQELEKAAKASSEATIQKELEALKNIGY